MRRSHTPPQSPPVHPPLHSHSQSLVSVPPFLHHVTGHAETQRLYLSDLLSDYRPTRSLRSESTILLTVPRTWTVTYYGGITFTKAAATLWNSLRANIRNTDTCIKFQRQLNTFLFRQQYVDNKSTYNRFYSTWYLFFLVHLFILMSWMYILSVILLFYSP